MTLTKKRCFSRPTANCLIYCINSWREKNFGRFSSLEKFSVVGRCFAIRASSNRFSITVLPRKRHISLILNLKGLDFGGRTSPTFREYSAHRTDNSHQNGRQCLLLRAGKPKERMSPKWLVYGCLGYKHESLKADGGLEGLRKMDGRGGGDFYKSFSPAKRKSYP